MSQEVRGYFDSKDSYKWFIKLLFGIIGVLIIMNLITVKSLINIVENKDIRIQVPSLMKEGEYIIGNSGASLNVHEMWVRVWLGNISNFSYSNIRKGYDGVYHFLDPQTSFKNKSELLKFIDFVETNFITQDFEVKDIQSEKLENGQIKVTAYGSLKRTIGKSKDELDGIRYAYEFITYVKNGQIYINSVRSYFYGLIDVQEKNKLKENKFVNFDEVIQ